MKIKNWSIAAKNATVLIMTLIPFVIGMGISIAKSSELDYFGNAINISGSQRMRTMLISNYSQQYYYDQSNEETRTLLSAELIKYQTFMNSLTYGDESLDLKENEFSNITDSLKLFESQYEEYVRNVEYLLDDPTNDIALKFILNNALSLKDNIHEVVGMFESQYNIELDKLKMIDIYIIVFSVALTLFGLYLTRRIKVFEKYSTYDYLTGLKTRRMIIEDLTGKDLVDYSLVFIDLDKFKLINDTYGHEVGDIVLIEVSKRLETIFSPSQVYRYAGDEFVVIIPSNERANVENFIDSFKISLWDPIKDDKGNNHFAGFSAGAITGNAMSLGLDVIIDAADDLMYDSKNYKSKMILISDIDELNDRTNLKNDILTAMDKNQIVPFIQPIVGRKKESLGYEILARWNYNGKVLSPPKFIPLLKRLGLMEKFDLYMLTIARDIFKTEDKSSTYSVNLSYEFIKSTRFDDHVLYLNNLNIPKEQMLIEVSENTIFDEHCIGHLKTLSDLGYYLVIDDFTAGNTSLETLKIDFIKRIKLDMSVVRNLNSNWRLIQELIAFLHSLDKKVLAEGIEDTDQFDKLLELGVDYFQGYLFSKPHKM